MLLDELPSGLHRVTHENGEDLVRLHGVFELYASPVGAGDRLYFADRDGTTIVVSHGAGIPKVLATNRLDDGFSASPALAGNELFLRGTEFLYCIAEQEKD